MAILQTSQLSRYYGLSTDTKPTDEAVIIGSLFTETDTGDVFLFDNAAGAAPAWVTLAPPSPVRLQATASLANVPAALTSVILVTIPRGVKRIMAIVRNTTADTLLSGFDIRVKPIGGTQIILATVAADFTTAITPPVIDASGDLNILPANGTGWFILDVAGLDTVECFASSVLATADLTIEIGSD